MAFLLFLLVNYLVFLLLRVFLLRSWLSITVILLSYYFLVRKVVTYIVFPGSFPLYRRKIENDFQKQMGKVVIVQV